MSFPLCLPICFLSSLCFSVMSTVFLLSKEKHTFPLNGIFRSVMCPWMGLLSFAENVNAALCACLCARVWGMRNSRGLSPEMGWVLLSFLNYLAHVGVCEWTLTVAITQGWEHDKVPFKWRRCNAVSYELLLYLLVLDVLYECAPSYAVFSYSGEMLRCCLYESLFTKRGCTDMSTDHQKDLVQWDWPKAHLASLWTL